ncbi:MAG: DUF3332 family protein [Alphaproteobacteria bacterium]|nr:DUF3332 family protein [Alphaproteobacteria bacterium]MCB9792751.1 DUF3332 family protein [Alphaproteobacteria bacterium]
MNRRAFLATTLPLAALTASGCIGSFALTKRVYNWNRSMGSPIVQEVIFLIFIFLPIYSIVLTIDGLLLNTIEFLTGKNPLAKGEGEDAEVVTELDEGTQLRLRRRRGQLELTLRHADGRREVHRFESLEDGMRVWDEDGALVAEARFDELGGILIRDGLGRDLGSVEEARVSEAAFAYEEQGAEAAIDVALSA